MTEQVRRGELADAVAAALGEQANAERYRYPQRRRRGVRAAALDRPRPLEFDPNGFPVAQPTPASSRV
jgi:hypothetical protein